MKWKTEIYRPNADNSIKMMNINVYKNTKQPRQYFSTKIYKTFREWNIGCNGKYAAKKKKTFKLDSIAQFY